MDQNQNQDKRRGHFHRGRRGPDRRGLERRGPQQTPPERPGRDQVDVEQIMRDIRSRIAQRQGIDLSNQQIQDLAARRLEAVLDPRAIKPSLLDGLRRSAGASTSIPREKIPNEPAYSFEDTTIYDSHRGSLRFMRRLLNPLLKLFFNPNPLIRALHLQARLNVEAAEREAERDQRQTEWNALHYEIVQRLVTEVSRLSLEVQAQSMRIESLQAKIDFTDRRVRGLEGATHRTRPPGRPLDAAVAPATPEVESAPAEPAAVVETQPVDGARRRRRRRRGRRSGAPSSEGAPAGIAAPQAVLDPEPEAREAPSRDSGVGQLDSAPAPDVEGVEIAPARNPDVVEIDTAPPRDSDVGQIDSAPAPDVGLGQTDSAPSRDVGLGQIPAHGRDQDLVEIDTGPAHTRFDTLSQPERREFAAEPPPIPAPTEPAASPAPVSRDDQADFDRSEQ